MNDKSGKLAASLEVLRTLQQEGHVAIRSAKLSRTHRERLVRGGFLQEVIRGWYISSSPETAPGDSTPWVASYWDFIAGYLEHRFGTEWSLDPDTSLLLHADEHRMPKQLVVRAPGAGNDVRELVHGTSVLEIRAALPEPGLARVLPNGLRIFSLPAALVDASPAFFREHPDAGRLVLSLVRDPSDVLALLLRRGRTTIAGRLAGAWRNLGDHRTADRILTTMRQAEFNAVEEDPFEGPPPLRLTLRTSSPWPNRLGLLWTRMRGPVMDCVPAPEHPPADMDTTLQRVQDASEHDAYHSLSIERYRVSEELIRRVRDGDWTGGAGSADAEHRNVLAARGYWLASGAVKESLRTALATPEDPAAIAERDIANWHRLLFAPSVEAGILRPEQLAGYRTAPVFIQGSQHVPPSPDAVRDCMPAFFDLLRGEDSPTVRAVLGHFLIGFIHPWPDGNGRIARFLMNHFFVSAGHPWTIIRVENRERYMAALETASISGDIEPFARFVAEAVDRGWPA